MSTSKIIRINTDIKNLSDTEFVLTNRAVFDKHTQPTIFKGFEIGLIENQFKGA
jgi:hypothetical protein